ncbi:MAG TPA: PilZ domain-containing protein [Candidatus Polarisedimenticolaceae bacterium]|nr:PilZ domain-containing protein [Candidatus Polarisedimenticolaceae bacterium]
MSRTIAERRSHARFRHQFEIEGPRDGAGAAARMVASDLSLGGLQCSSSHDYPEMTRLAVRLQLPSGTSAEPVDLEAVVVRRRELPAAAGGGRYELALFFTSMNDDARERLARFLARATTN